MELVNKTNNKKHTTKSTSSTNSKHKHINDAYLGEGSFGCVLTPQINCTGKETIINKASKSNKTVSKIFIEKEDYDQEIAASRIIKKVDRDILARVNTFQGTKAVHTLNYLHKIPSRKENLTKIDEIVLILRSLYVICVRNDYYKERRKRFIRLVK